MNPKNNNQNVFQGSAAKFRIAVIVSHFNNRITEKLLDGCKNCLIENGVPEKSIKVFYCPGSFELPQVANKLAAQKKWDAIICLGAVIRGETPHFEYVSAETAHGIQLVALNHSIPVIFGVLTTDNEQQALDRAGGSQGHKGRDAALTALEMISLFQKIKRATR